jgi:hypothetical protein
MRNPVPARRPAEAYAAKGDKAKAKEIFFKVVNFNKNNWGFRVPEGEGAEKAGPTADKLRIRSRWKLHPIRRGGRAFLDVSRCDALQRRVRRTFFFKNYWMFFVRMRNESPTHAPVQGGLLATPSPSPVIMVILNTRLISFSLL